MIRVAIIDDHAVVRMGLKYALMLEKDMSCIAELDDGSTAAELVTREKPDVTLLDIRMPKVDGLCALASILRTAPEAKVIMLTTSDADDNVYRAVNLGAKGYVLKDRDSQSITTAIRKVAAGETYFPDEVTALYKERQQMPDLTPRETEVLDLLSKALSNSEIGATLGISPDCAKIHLKHIFEKFGVNDRVECVTEAQRRGFLM